MLSRWFELWNDLREVIVLLHAPYYATFMYSENRFASVFQSAEALHKKDFQSRELDKSSHKNRVRAITHAAGSAGLEPETMGWAGRVLQRANYKPLWRRIEELIKSTGAVGEAILHVAPEFATMAANARTGVAHGGGSSGRPEAVARYWHGEVLSWAVRARLLLDLGVPLTEVEQRVLQRGPFQHALEQIRADAE
jgi:hypothetical protein